MVLLCTRHGAPSPNQQWLISVGQSSPPCIHFQSQWCSWKFAGRRGLLLEQTTAKMSSLLKLIGNSCSWFGSSAGLAPPASKLGVDSSPNASSLGTTTRPAGCCLGRLKLMKVSFYLVWLFFIEKRQLILLPLFQQHKVSLLYTLLCCIVSLVNIISTNLLLYRITISSLLISQLLKLLQVSNHL